MTPVRDPAAGPVGGGPESELAAMMARDYGRVREVGTALAEAALRVVREKDGLHRLSLAVAAWAKAVADEGDRPFVPCDKRLPGLEYAEGIAEHWHQRFLLLRDEAQGAARRRNLSEQAEGAARVLDDIKDECKRFKTPAGRAALDASAAESGPTSEER